MSCPLVFGTCNNLKQLLLYCFSSKTAIKDGNNNFHIFLKKYFIITVCHSVAFDPNSVSFARLIFEFIKSLGICHPRLKALITLYSFILQQLWQLAIHALAGTQQVWGLFLRNQIDLNIVWLKCWLHCISVKHFTTHVCVSQILPNLYSICVGIFLPQEVRAATSQSTLLPPAARFAKAFRDAAYFSTVCVGGSLTIHISETWRIS